MGVSSDEFFNNFDASPQGPPRGVRQRGGTAARPGPPPPAARRPLPPPAATRTAPAPQKQQQQQQRNYMLQQPALNHTHSPQPSYYGQQQSQQQSQQQPYASQQTPPSNEWYTPTPDLSKPLQQQQQHQHQQQQPLYATNHYMDGTMDTSGRSGGSGGGGTNNSIMQPMHAQPFVPQQSQYSSHSTMIGDPNDMEPPLLEELGVNLEHIVMKTKAVVLPFRRLGASALQDPGLIVQDADLAGPLCFALLLGGELMLTGKLQFGSIYGFGVFGCLAMTVILNLMSPEKAVSVWTVASILGYALLPVNLLAAIKLVLFHFTSVIQILAFLTVLWSTTASTRLLEIGCGMSDQRYLLAYPIALLYSAFVLITMF